MKRLLGYIILTIAGLLILSMLFAVAIAQEGIINGSFTVLGVLVFVGLIYLAFKLIERDDEGV